MKKLVCEMCGSTDIAKENGMFVCQACGVKYSLEEAKKMMIEGTVEVAGTVKVDDSAKIENYYTMAENAYTANNQKEAEDYCNKIIEISPTDYRAWMLKGQAAGWQSTVKNIRIEESVHCFTKAIDNAPEDAIEKLKEKVAVEISNLSKALMQLCCNNFAKYPSNDNKLSILENLLLSKRFSLLLLTKCNVKPTEFNKAVATMMNIAACTAWKDVVTQDYQHSDHPSKYVFETFQQRSLACLAIIAEAIDLSDDDAQEDIQRYKNLITIRTQFMNGCSYRYSGELSSYVKEISLTDEAKKVNVDLIMTYHQKIKEIDDSYEIPQPPVPASGGCYVATAVYGSYDCPQVWTLRRYRDDTLAQTWYGRLFIHTYYAISPTLVKYFGHTTWFKKMWKGKLDAFVDKLQSEGVESAPYMDKKW